MFFEHDDEMVLNPEIIRVVHREFYAITSNLSLTPYGLRNIPTHTEDGIPIRKLYVSNLPPKATRTELFNVFAQYGFIKNCWLRMGDKGPNKPPTPTYAFVTFSDPADAYKALLAPTHEKVLHGRNLKISPADSWHQPAEDADGKVHWKPRGPRQMEEDTTAASNGGPSTESGEANSSQEGLNIEGETSVTEDSYNILDILNTDCLSHILTFVPIKDLIQSERVSKSWQNMVQEYFQSIRTFKTSWWVEDSLRLTTAVLRRVLRRVGGSLVRLHIDHQLSALNDRTAHTVGKFCPNLDELKVVGMYTKNWNPIIYGCKQLRVLSFISCNRLTDSSLVHIVKADCIESLLVANNTHVTGIFLTGSNPRKLNSLSFYNCCSLQGTVLCAALDTLPNLTTLKLDVCPMTMWKIIPMILKKVPKLEELSLSEYASFDSCVATQGTDAFCEALSHLTELKTLNISRNIYINNAVMKQISQTCTQLETLNISSCNSIRSSQQSGVNDEGVRWVCSGCRSLRRLDVSYLAALSSAGLRHAARLPALRVLVARGNNALAAAPLAALLAACPRLQEIDVCGCDNVCSELFGAAVEALTSRPRALTLRVVGTAAAADLEVMSPESYPSHPLLRVDVYSDRCNPNLRPEHADDCDTNTDDSIDDIYAGFDDFDDLLDSDDYDYEGYEGYDGYDGYDYEADIIII